MLGARAHRQVIASVVVALAMLTTAHAAGLVVERSIALPNVTGRIDHLATDSAGKVLYVAEHDNGTLDVVDLAAGKPIGRIDNLSEPQGVAYLADENRVVIGNGGDGSARFFDAATFSPVANTSLGGDADNVRIDPVSRQVVVGYGDGGLAFLNPDNGQVARQVKLPAHPESFQLSPDGARAFVNLPDAGQIGVIDLKTNKLSGISTPGLAANFPMAVDSASGMLLVAFRSPAKLALVDVDALKVVSLIDTCGDADDIFVDGKRSLVYVVCGAGAVAIARLSGTELLPQEQIATGDGARTGLFVPALDRLFVAAPAHNGESAKILVLRPGLLEASANSPPVNSQTVPRPSAGQGDLGQFVGSVIDDADTFWARYFRDHSGNGGYVAPEAYTAPEIVAYADQTQSGCGAVGQNSGSFYCPRDAKIYLEMGNYHALHDRPGASGDLSEAFVIAHEVGHHVQNLLGILPTFSKRRSTMTRTQADAYSAGIELQADCFAGMFAKSEKRFLDNGDIDEAIDAANQVGDDMLTRNTTSPRTATHGTSAQRSQWFKTGLSSTDVTQCDTGIPKPWAYYQP